MSDDEPRVPSAETGSQTRQKLAVFGPVVAAFGIVTAAVVVAAYRFGEGVIYINDRTISDFNILEVTTGAAVGVIGALVGLGAAAVGSVAALIATIVGVGVGALGLVLGAVVVIGVVTGPVLLVTIIGILIKRRYWPDVI